METPDTATQPATPAYKPFVEINFAAIESTIKQITDKSDQISMDTFKSGCELGEAEVELSRVEANVALGVRNSGQKVTEGTVADAVSVDPNVIAMRNKVARLRAKSAAIRNDAENIHGVRRMIVAWMAGQTKAGQDL